MRERIPLRPCKPNAAVVLNKAVDLRTAYLPGCLADKYDVDSHTRLAGRRFGYCVLCACMV